MCSRQKTFEAILSVLQINPEPTKWFEFFNGVIADDLKRPDRRDGVNPVDRRDGVNPVHVKNVNPVDRHDEVKTVNLVDRHDDVKTVNHVTESIFALGYLFFLPDQMQKLFDLAEKLCDREDGNTYKYCHALCPHALLVRENLNRCVSFYYEHLSKTKEQIFQLWTNRDFASNIGDFRVAECAICLESIIFGQQVCGNNSVHKTPAVGCPTCVSWNHIQCFDKFFLQNKKSLWQCHVCKAHWDSQSFIKFAKSVLLIRKPQDTGNGNSVADAGVNVNDSHDDGDDSNEGD